MLQSRKRHNQEKVDFSGYMLMTEQNSLVLWMLSLKKAISDSVQILNINIGTVDVCVRPTTA